MGWFPVWNLTLFLVLCVDLFVSSSAQSVTASRSSQQCVNGAAYFASNVRDWSTLPQFSSFAVCARGYSTLLRLSPQEALEIGIDAEWLRAVQALITAQLNAYSTGIPFNASCNQSIGNLQSALLAELLDNCDSVNLNVTASLVSCLDLYNNGTSLNGPPSCISTTPTPAMSPSLLINPTPSSSCVRPTSFWSSTVEDWRYNPIATGSAICGIGFGNLLDPTVSIPGSVEWRNAAAELVTTLLNEYASNSQATCDKQAVQSALFADCVGFNATNESDTSVTCLQSFNEGVAPGGPPPCPTPLLPTPTTISVCVETSVSYWLANANDWRKLMQFSTQALCGLGYFDILSQGFALQGNASTEAKEWYSSVQAYIIVLLNTVYRGAPPAPCDMETLHQYLLSSPCQPSPVLDPQARPIVECLNSYVTGSSAVSVCPTYTPSPSFTGTPSSTLAPSPSPSDDPTPSSSATETLSASPTETPSPSPTGTQSPSTTETPSPFDAESLSPSASPTGVPTETLTVVSQTFSPSSSSSLPSPSSTDDLSPSYTPTPSLNTACVDPVSYWSQTSQVQSWRLVEPFSTSALCAVGYVDIMTKDNIVLPGQEDWYMATRQYVAYQLNTLYGGAEATSCDVASLVAFVLSACSANLTLSANATQYVSCLSSYNGGTEDGGPVACNTTSAATSLPSPTRSMYWRSYGPFTASAFSSSWVECERGVSDFIVDVENATYYWSLESIDVREVLLSKLYGHHNATVLNYWSYFNFSSDPAPGFIQYVTYTIICLSFSTTPDFQTGPTSTPLPPIGTSSSSSLPIPVWAIFLLVVLPMFLVLVVFLLMNMAYFSRVEHRKTTPESTPGWTAA